MAPRTSSEILDGLEADGILRVVEEQIDPDAVLFVLEDTVGQLLELLGPILVADDRRAPMLFAAALPEIRGVAHLVSSALLIHQAAREVTP